MKAYRLFNSPFRIGIFKVKIDDSFDPRLLLEYNEHKILSTKDSFQNECNSLHSISTS